MLPWPPEGVATTQAVKDRWELIAVVERRRVRAVHVVVRRVHEGGGGAWRGSSGVAVLECADKEAYGDEQERE